LAKTLIEKYNVWIVVYYGDQVDDNFQKIIETNKINTVKLRGNHFRKIYSFYCFLKFNKIDVIFSYLLTTNFIGGIIGKLAGVKNSIGGIRSSKLEEKKEILQKFIHNYLSSRTIYNNYKGYDLLSNRGFNSNKALVIQNCFEINKEQVTHINNDKITILSVGRFHKAKDYLTAIKSIVKLKETYHNFIFYIIGYGELEDQIRNWIYEHKANEFIVVLINPNNINEYYRKSDIYLMTSIFEGLSNTVLEAMSFSLPLVLTDVGDNNRLVIDKQNGYLCDAKDIEKITNRLIILCNSYKKRILFGKNSYEILKENYTQEKFKERYINLIEQLSEMK
jgi:glycosyltransferase involved in cell wall biosynthesis